LFCINLFKDYKLRNVEESKQQGIIEKLLSK